MNKDEIKTYFDKWATCWDDHMIIDDETTNKILDFSLIKDSDSILDVGCGTGVLIPYYLQRTDNITGIDLSEKMIEIASNKYPNINLVCGDVNTYNPGNNFDHIMIYNAFPHFINPDLTISHLYGLLNDGGTITIAHNMSYEQLKKHHSGSACNITNSILNQDELNNLFKNNNLEIITSVFDDNKMIVVGRKK